MPCCKGDEYGNWCKDEPIVYTDEEGKEYCVFHAPVGAEGKTEDRLNAFLHGRLSRAKKDDDVCDLRGAIFPYPVIFPNLIDDNNCPSLKLNYAKFIKNVNFDWLNLAGRISAVSVHFGESLIMGGCKINASIELVRCTVNGDIDLSSCEIEKFVYCRDTKCHGKVDLSSAKVNNGVSIIRINCGNKLTLQDSVVTGPVAITGGSIKELDLSRLDCTSMVSIINVDGCDMFRVNDGKIGAMKIERLPSPVMKFEKASFQGKVIVADSGCDVKCDFKGVSTDSKIYLSDLVINEFDVSSSVVENIVVSNCVWPKGYRLYPEIELDLWGCVSYGWTKFKNRLFYGKYKVSASNHWCGSHIKDAQRYEQLYRKFRKQAQGENDQHLVSAWHYREKEWFRRLPNQCAWWHDLPKRWKWLSKFTEKHKWTARVFGRCDWLRRTPLSVSWWYWLLSGYNERPGRAFGWLVLLLLLPLLPWGAIPWPGCSAAADAVTTGIEKLISYIPLAGMSANLSGLPGPAKIAWPIGRLLLLVQTPLFIVALRNRFRR